MLLLAFELSSESQRRLRKAAEMGTMEDTHTWGESEGQACA